MTRIYIPPHLTCEEASKLFDAHIQGSLDTERKGRVIGHLRTCDSCSEAYSIAMDGAEEKGTLPLPSPQPLPTHLRGGSPLKSLGPSWRQVAGKKGNLVWELTRETFISVKDNMVQFLTVPPELKLASIAISRGRAISIQAPTPTNLLNRINNSLVCNLPNSTFSLKLELHQLSPQVRVNLFAFVVENTAKEFLFNLIKTNGEEMENTHTQRKCGGDPAEFLGLSGGNYTLQIQEPSGHKFLLPLVVQI